MATEALTAAPVDLRLETREPLLGWLVNTLAAGAASLSEHSGKSSE